MQAPPWLCTTSQPSLPKEVCTLTSPDSWIFRVHTAAQLYTTWMRNLVSRSHEISLYSSSNIFRVMHREMRNSYKTLFKKYQGKSSFVRVLSGFKWLRMRSSDRVL
jgi:hypothetical protein